MGRCLGVASRSPRTLRAAGFPQPAPPAGEKTGQTKPSGRGRLCQDHSAADQTSRVAGRVIIRRMVWEGDRAAVALAVDRPHTKKELSLDRLSVTEVRLPAFIDCFHSRGS